MLTQKQLQFVREYLIDLNGKQAAIRCGYSVKTAEFQASRLLSKDKVALEIQKAMDKRSQRTEITADRVLEELAKLAFSNTLDYVRVTNDGMAVVDLSALTRDQAAAISEFTIDEYVDGKGEDAREVKKVKFKLADKRAALVDLGRHLELFTDRVKINSELTDDELTKRLVERGLIAPPSEDA